MKNFPKRIVAYLIYGITAFLGYYGLALVFGPFFGKYEGEMIFVGLFIVIPLAVLVGSLLLPILGEVTFKEYINGLRKVLWMILRGILDFLLFFVGLVCTHLLLIILLLLPMIHLIGSRDFDIHFDYQTILISLIVLGIALYAIKSIYKIEGNLITIYLGSWKMGIERLKKFLKWGRKR